MHLSKIQQKNLPANMKLLDLERAYAGCCFKKSLQEDVFMD